MRWLALVVLAGAALRIAGLDAQSFWRDEASTVMGLSGGFDDTVRWIVENEAMPPLHLVLAWLWSQPFGLGEVGLRSLSTVLGIATIPVAYAIGRTYSDRAGLLAAALVAANPFLVWYSQEARAYALLALVTALATLMLVRDRPRAWGWFAAAALLTHYFAAFLVVGQAVLIIVRHRRESVAALAPPALVGLALIPLLLTQKDGRVDGIPRAALDTRLADVAKHWVAGPFGTPADVLGLLALIAVGAGLALALRARLGGALAFPAAAAIAFPALVALIGTDYVADRYLIGALVPLLAVAAAGFARFWWAGAGLALLFAGLTVGIAVNDRLHREDWRGVARGLGPAAVVATADGDRALRVYAPGAETLARDTATRLVFVASWRFGRERPPNPLPPGTGFELAGRDENPTTTVISYEAPTPRPIDRDALALGWRLYNQPPVLLDVPG